MTVLSTMSAEPDGDMTQAAYILGDSKRLSRSHGAR